MEILLAVLITFVVIPIMQPIAVHFGLVDKPDARKHHEGAVPLIGGLSIFVAVATACFFAFDNSAVINLFLISSALIVFLGTMDDYHDLSVRSRIVAQVLIASIMVFGAGLALRQLGDIFGLGPIGTFLFGPALTIFAVLAAINAFNMSDGIDGLAGSLAMNTYAAIAVLFLLAGDHQYLTLPVILFAAVLPFVFFNLSLIPGPVKKVFMGDAGSMFIGLSVVWLLVIGSQGENAAFRPVTALWIIAVPFMDMSAIVYRRMRKGQSPMKPDRDHLHHIFMRAGFSPRGALLVISTLALLLSAIGILGEVLNAPEWLMFYGFIGLFLAYATALSHIWRVLMWFHRRFPIGRFLKAEQFDEH